MEAPTNNDLNITTIQFYKQKWQTADQLEFIIVIIKCILSPFILLGNALTVIAIAKYPKLKTVTNAMVMSLAASDLMVGLIAFMDITLYYIEDRSKWLIFCEIKEQ